MKKTRVTIRDVARDAGVSVTTVSHALNGKGKVSVETIARVESTAKLLGYQPSATAQALRTGRSGAIALILPRVSDEVSQQIVGLDYYMCIAVTAAATAFGHNRPLILPPDLRTPAEWGSLNPDGVLLCDPAENDPHIDLLEGIGIPVVTIERDNGRPDWTHYVAGDNTANTCHVLDHLRDAGARRIALLSSDWSRAWTADINAEYIRWTQAHGYETLLEAVPVEVEQRDAFEAARSLLDGPEPPDAFYAPAEGYGAGVLRACADRGLRVPEDVLLVAGNDGNEFREGAAAVTAVDLRPEQQTQAAIQLLIARIDGDDSQGPIIVPSQLRVRASSVR